MLAFLHIVRNFGQVISGTPNIHFRYMFIYNTQIHMNTLSDKLS